jgi:hypothetical protein
MNSARMSRQQKKRDCVVRGLAMSIASKRTGGLIRVTKSRGERLHFMNWAVSAAEEAVADEQ